MIGAVLGALGGIVGGLSGINTGYDRSSTSLLSPAQQLQNLQMMMAISPYMQGHFSTLSSLGQNSPDAYGTLPQFRGDYNSKVLAPQQSRQRNMMQGMGDPWHSDSAGKTRQRFTTEQRLGTNSLRNALMLQDLGMRTEGLDNAANRRLQSYGATTESWMYPMGRVRENYITPDVDYGSIVGGAGSALSSLAKTFGNIGQSAQNSGFYGKLSKAVS